MTAGQAPDTARLEELRRRFDETAYTFPRVDAVVVFRPDLRREEAERQGRDSHFRPADPSSDNFAAEHAAQTRSTYAAIRAATEWNAWIPPSDRTIGQLGDQTYWERLLRADECPDFRGPPARIELWRCILFGPPVDGAENTALRLFNMLAADAARLGLSPRSAKGKGLLSRWLIHLAARREPIEPDSRRRFLHWSTLGGKRLAPMWIPVTSLNPSSCWWAVRLTNVFQRSRTAIEQAIDLAGLAESPSAGSAAGLAVIPAGFTFHGKEYTLIGKPLVRLRVLLNSPHRRCSAEQLREAIGLDDAVVTYPEQVIRDTAKRLRAALVKAVSASGISCKTPLLSKGKGEDLTYILAIP